MKQRMTIEIANAIGADAANVNMCKAGRTAWSKEDYAVACSTVTRLLKEYDFFSPVNCVKLPKGA